MSQSEVLHDAYEPEAEVLTAVAENFSFSTFVHFRELEDVSRENDIPVEQWDLLLRDWGYEPTDFLERNRRGNCVDFARYTQQALGAIGLDSVIIGSQPSNAYTATQSAHMRYRHTSLLSDSEDGLVMFEPGWKIPRAVPLEPVGNMVDTGPWQFTTLELSDSLLVQETVSPTGYGWQRRFGLQPVHADDAATMTKHLLRVPRKLEMLTPLVEGTPEFIVSYDHKTDALTSNIPELAPTFEPSDISTKVNERISDAFGFDVKEELVASLGIRKKLPDEYWVK